MAMASEGPKSAALILLTLNLVLYFIVIVIASWAMNHGIQRSKETGNSLKCFILSAEKINYMFISTLN